MKKLKICIISEEAYPYFKGKDGGGSELQMFYLAQQLVKRGHEVYFITFGKAENYYENIMDINLYNPYFNKKKGWTHFFPDKLFKYFNLLRKINADVYIQRAGPPTSSLIRFLNKIFILSIGDEASVDSYLKIDSITDLKYICHIWNIKASNCVICQTNHQKDLLEKNTSKKGILIKNFYIPNMINFNNDPEYVIWVGRLIQSKSPELFLRLAVDLPEYKFKMIGGTSYGDEEYFEKIRKRAVNIKNLEFLSNVPHKEIDKYYSGALLLINTSSSEGFPNIFLESWANCTPIVSLNFDPDNILNNYDLGFNTKNFEQMKSKVKKLIKDNLLRKKMGINSYNYVKKVHNIVKITDEYERLFEILNPKK